MWVFWVSESHLQDFLFDVEHGRVRADLQLDEVAVHCLDLDCYFLYFLHSLQQISKCAQL